MGQVHSGKFVKYGLYYVSLPALGYLSMFLLRPFTKGAPDGGFLGMVIGIIIAQVFFSMAILQHKKGPRILLGLLTFVLCIAASFIIVGFLVGDAGQTVITEVLFFVIYLILATLITEKLNQRRK